MKTIARRLLVCAVSIALVVSAAPRLASAAIIGTLEALQTAHQDNATTEVTAFLARDDVSARLVALGVDPAAAQARVAALSPTEAQVLAAKIDDLPAGGGALAVLGIVFLVLLVLELVGAINIFKKI